MPRAMRSGAVVLSTSALMVVFGGRASASKPAQLSGTSVVVPGGRVVVKLALHLATDTCRLRASTGPSWQTLSTVNPERANLEWSWRVAADTRAATWHLQAACESEHWSRQLRVRGRAHRPSTPKLVGGWVRFRESGAALPSASAGSLGERAPASGEAPNPLPGTLPSGGAVFSLDDGACTDWADYKRPDIY